MRYSDQDTIAAIATALGEAGIGIVRISGPDAVAMADAVFHPKRPPSLAETSGFRIRYGTIRQSQASMEVIDQALALVMRAPKSFTGEDVVELHSHGGVAAVRKTLEVVLHAGARLAEPGEFTKRAFFNGRMDLSQAEAVIDIVRARTDASLQAAVDQAEGSLSRSIGKLRDTLYDLVVHIEAAIDYPEDDIPEPLTQDVEQGIADTLAEITMLLETASEGKALREGIRTVIAGRPNVGKSSLLNRLLDENRAIVTDVPGTTRDVIEEVFSIEGIPFRIIDTAGIRSSVDAVERIGIERALALLEQADLVLLVLDRSMGLSAEDHELLERTAQKHRILVVNKRDLPSAWSLDDLPPASAEERRIVLSLLEDDLEPLRKALLDSVKRTSMEAGRSAVITRVRHKECLEYAKDELALAEKAVADAVPLDLVVINLMAALERLGEIQGETVRENMIDRIFAEFCIGK